MDQIYGQKVGMTRFFTEAGESVPVTVIRVEPNTVFQVKTAERDGYQAVQVGFGAQKAQRVNRPRTGHLARAKKGTPRYVRELRPKDTAEIGPLQVGDEIQLADVMKTGARVDVVGISIGKGFAGVMKRHGMKGQPASRGTHEYERHAGSIGCRKFPGHVFKNKRMAGHMGVDRVTQLGLEVVAVRAEDHLLLLRGSVPGPKNGVVLVRAAVKGRE